MCDLISILTLPSAFGLALCVCKMDFISFHLLWLTRIGKKARARAHAHVNAKVPVHIAYRHYLYDTFKVISVYNLKKSTISLWPHRTQMLTHARGSNQFGAKLTTAVAVQFAWKSNHCLEIYRFFSIDFVLESVPKESKTDK